MQSSRCVSECRFKGGDIRGKDRMCPWVKRARTSWTYVHAYAYALPVWAAPHSTHANRYALRERGVACAYLASPVGRAPIRHMHVPHGAPHSTYANRISERRYFIAKYRRSANGVEGRKATGEGSKASGVGELAARWKAMSVAERAVRGWGSVM